MRENEFNIDAVLSIFDKNQDGKISKSEFNTVTEAQYNKFIEQLKEYNKSQKEEQGRILDYKNLAQYLDDGVISTDELSGHTYTYGFKGKDVPEVKHLKDTETMNEDELLAEYRNYGLEPSKRTLKAMQRELEDIRKEAAQYDSGSDEVDGHIGSFVQGGWNDCTYKIF